MKTRITRISVMLDNRDIYDDGATHIEIMDEGGGEFITISQPDNAANIRIDLDEWPAIRAAVNKLIKECNE